jgi:hypothetical protein
LMHSRLHTVRVPLPDTPRVYHQLPSLLPRACAPHYAQSTSRCARRSDARVSGVKKSHCASCTWASALNATLARTTSANAAAMRSISAKFLGFGKSVIHEFLNS